MSMTDLLPAAMNTPSMSLPLKNTVFLYSILEDNIYRRKHIGQRASGTASTDASLRQSRVQVAFDTACESCLARPGPIQWRHASTMLLAQQTHPWYQSWILARDDRDVR